MAKVYAGTYSRPTGKAGGIVWGAARSRAAKVATTREYSIPTNPDTAAQQERRAIFRTAVTLLSQVPNQIYANAWDNTLGLLPGWQSCLAYLISQLSWTSPDLYATFPAVATELGPKSLGPCYNPGVTISSTTGSTLVLTWATGGTGDHVGNDDALQYVCVTNDLNPPVSGAWIKTSSGAAARSAGTYTIPDLASTTDYRVIAWFRHAEPDGTYTYSPISGPGDATT